MPMPQNEFPMPANLRPSSGPPPSAEPTANMTPLSSAGALAALLGSGRETFRLDSDLREALRDMQQASGEAWQPFLEKAVNESLRFWMGR